MRLLRGREVVRSEQRIRPGTAHQGNHRSRYQTSTARLMNLIVCNIGSSSFKFQLLDMRSEQEVARGYTERVGSEKATITYWRSGQQVFNTTQQVASHREAVQHALRFLVAPAAKLLGSPKEIAGVG